MRRSHASSLVVSIAAALVAASAVHAELGWRWEHPLPTSDHLWPVWGTGPDNVYAGGSDGTVIHYDGTSWRVVLESWSSFYAIGGSGPDDVWAVGGGQVRHFDGTSWKVDLSMPPGYSWHGVWAVAPDDVHVVGTGSGLTAEFGHFDGTGWTITPSPIFSPLEGIWGRASNDVWAVARAALLHFDGSGWEVVEPAPGADLMRIWGVDSDRIFVGTSGGDVLLWNGEDLDPIGSGLDYVTGISGSGENDVEIVTYGGRVHRWDGSVWTHTGTSPGTRLMGLWTADASQAFAVGDSGTILHRQGTAWRLATQGPPASLLDVWAFPGGEAVAVGASGVTLRYEDGSWTQSPRFDGRDFLSAVWGATPDDVWAVGNDAIVHFDGSAWTKVFSPQVHLVGVWGSGPSDVYAVGIGASFHFDGISWNEIELGGAETVARDIWGSGPDDVFAVGEDGTIVHFDGSTWGPMTSGTDIDLRSVWGTGPADVWAVGSDSSAWVGCILHFDGGQWTEVTASAIGPPLWHVTGSGPGDVHATGIYGVMRFDGSAWREVEVPAGLSPAAVAPAGSAGTIFVGSNGAVARRLAQFASDFERQNLCSWSSATPVPDCWPFLP